MTMCGRLLAAILLLLAHVTAFAREFPTKPIRLIVPFPPGGPNDIIARVIGQKMSELTKQPIVVDNRAGQRGVLGTDAVAKAAPDFIAADIKKWAKVIQDAGVVTAK